MHLLSMSQKAKSSAVDDCSNNSETNEERGRRTSATEELSRTASMREEWKTEMEHMMAMSLALTLQNVSRRAGKETTDEVIQLLHDDKFNLNVFKKLVKGSSDCEEITQDVVKPFKE